METFEDLYTHQVTTKESMERGIRFDQCITKEHSELEETVSILLHSIVRDYPYLSHVEVIFISPKDEPNTGGFFHRVQIDKDTFVPTIYIVSEDQEHLQRLKSVRESSARRVAELLGIDFSELTPSLLRNFIIAHEIGHASDYVKNYEKNPAYKDRVISDEWDLHYQANLFTLPVPGFDPVDLRDEVSRYESIEECLRERPELKNVVSMYKIKKIEDLLSIQELAYRHSTYESYADNFATDFLKRNAKELGFVELLSTSEF